MKVKDLQAITKNLVGLENYEIAFRDRDCNPIEAEITDSGMVSYHAASVYLNLFVDESRSDRLMQLEAENIQLKADLDKINRSLDILQEVMGDL